MAAELLAQLWAKGREGRAEREEKGEERRERGQMQA